MPSAKVNQVLTDMDRLRRLAAENATLREQVKLLRDALGRLVYFHDTDDTPNGDIWESARQLWDELAERENTQEHSRRINRLAEQCRQTEAQP